LPFAELTSGSAVPLAHSPAAFVLAMVVAKSRWICPDNVRRTWQYPIKVSPRPKSNSLKNKPGDAGTRLRDGAAPMPVDYAAFRRNTRPRRQSPALNKMQLVGSGTAKAMSSNSKLSGKIGVAVATTLENPVWEVMLT